MALGWKCPYGHGVMLHLASTIYACVECEANLYTTFLWHGGGYLVGENDWVAKELARKLIRIKQAEVVTDPR